MKFLLALLFVSSLGIYFLSQGFKRDQTRAAVYIPPPEYIERMSFGYDESLADSLWLRYVQDIDICGKKKTISNYSQLTKKKSSDLRFQESAFESGERNFCQRSWAFRLLDAVTKLAPKFRMPYYLGASTLSILINDVEGAKIIFDRGIQVFPKDWKVLHAAAYHYLYEVRDLKKAARLLSRSSMNGAPSWMASLAARIYSREGQIELGIQTLEAHKKLLTDPKKILWIQKRLNKLYSIQRK